LKRRLGGGLTGDVYGYLVVCCEIALVLGIVAILRFT
jgi:cobalamin synthase